MPAYDYSCPCGHEQEVSHGMMEEPEILCEKCGEKMKKMMSLGYGGFKLTSGGTRRRDYGTRYGGKKQKSDHTPSPSESAHAKALAQKNERESKSKESSDPYSAFR